MTEIYDSQENQQQETQIETDKQDNENNINISTTQTVAHNRVNKNKYKFDNNLITRRKKQVQKLTNNLYKNMLPSRK